MSIDVIIGKHSIYAAIKNPERSGLKLFATREGQEAFHSEFRDIQSFKSKYELVVLDKNAFEREWTSALQDNEHQYVRCPSDIFLISPERIAYDVGWIFAELKQGRKLKILCLDSLTDVHNGAAIIRTAAFFGMDAIVTSSKGIFSVSPHFYRISSGGLEYTKLIRPSSLPAFIQKLQESNVHCLGLSDHASQKGHPPEKNSSICLVIGAEDKGISNAVLRILQHTVCLDGPGVLKTLNASVAAALAMERFCSGRSGQ
ncbi:MAG: hypothetical protein A2X86_04505 [Bdellovibrionales bacterium GWA2_49_15]|nr:MAG: hypothetical protein A2X86_04505 [Bdellovibrionales bacterium GWA2_49_15]